MTTLAPVHEHVRSLHHDAIVGDVAVGGGTGPARH
jgi:hypothetical protein